MVLPDNALKTPSTAAAPPAWQSALVGVIAGFAYGILGFFVLTLLDHPRMGTVFFLFFPFVVGATIALFTPRPLPAVTLLSTTISLLFCLFALITLHAEGLLCAILAFPVVFASLAVGVGMGLLIRILIYPFRNSTANSLILLAAPVLILTTNHFEMKSFSGPRTLSVVTTVHLAATPDQVWANIQSLDSLTGTKPILMHLGLPVPQRCVLKGMAAGSKRICYFDQGSIEETILEWDPPRRMRLSIDRTNLPGRRWLEFDGAEYVLQPDPAGTIVTRTTTIRSNLAPAWYWARFERWGVSSEHNYLFRDLANRFSEKN